ncbi:MAG: hypothetical protein ACR2ML_08860, partial [Solirubrobacteraceae bacterium]
MSPPPPPPGATADAVAAPRGAPVAPANIGQRFKKGSFCALLVFCVFASGILLGTIFFDVIRDGGGKLSLDF